MKLIDWELRKQLQWAAFFFATVLGMLSLLASNLLATGELVFSAIYFLLFLPINYSFSRMALSVSVMRNYYESLQSKLMKQEMVDKAVASWLFDLFAERGTDNKWHTRKWFVATLVLIGDLLFILAFRQRVELGLL